MAKQGKGTVCKVRMVEDGFEREVVTAVALHRL